MFALVAEKVELVEKLAFGSQSLKKIFGRDNLFTKTSLLLITRPEIPMNGKVG